MDNHAQNSCATEDAWGDHFSAGFITEHCAKIFTRWQSCTGEELFGENVLRQLPVKR